MSITEITCWLVAINSLLLIWQSHLHRKEIKGKDDRIEALEKKVLVQINEADSAKAFSKVLENRIIEQQDQLERVLQTHREQLTVRSNREEEIRKKFEESNQKVIGLNRELPRLLHERDTAWRKVEAIIKLAQEPAELS